MAGELTLANNFNRFRWKEMAATTMAAAALTACGVSERDATEQTPVTTSPSLSLAEIVCDDLQDLMGHLRYSEDPYTADDIVRRFNGDSLALVEGVEGREFVTDMKIVARTLSDLSVEVVAASNRDAKLQALGQIENIATAAHIRNC